MSTSPSSLASITNRIEAVEWFRSARYGLFMHYGLYSLLGGEWKGQRQTKKGAEWIQLEMNIPVAEYAKLKDRFNAARFDPDAICQLARDAGMRYINLTTQHHDGFCLWDTATTDFSSMHAPARRDLVRELAEACSRHDLAFHCYYSHGRDWWHPDSPLIGEWSSRPSCPEDQDHFHWKDDYDLNRYLDLVEAQVLELCAIPGVHAIWLDGIGGFKNMEDGVRLSRAQELYDKVHATSPSIMIAYKQGLTYTEDFYAPERQIKDGTVPADSRPYEICTTLQPKSWGYAKADDGTHQNADWIMEQLAIAAAIPANLLLNTGPLPDGNIDEEDATALRTAGERLKKDGWPGAAR